MKILYIHPQQFFVDDVSGVIDDYGFYNFNLCTREARYMIIDNLYSSF